MKYRQSIIRILVLVLFLTELLSCKEESQEQINYTLAMEQVRFTCTDTITSFYFQAYLNEDEICYHNGVDNYFAQAAVVNTYFTILATIDFSDPSTYSPLGSWFQFGFFQPERSHFNEEFVLECPVDTFGSSFINLVEKYLKQGE